MPFPTLQNYDVRRQLIPDILAGISVASLAIPQAMGNALLAGEPPVYGLYGVVQLGYSILGNSPTLVVGPIAVTALLTSGALHEAGIQPFSQEWITSCALLSFIVGCYQLLFALLKLGEAFSSILSETTTKAFAASGVATLIAAQLKDLSGSANLVNFYANPNKPTLLLSFGCLLLLEYFKNCSSRLGPIITIIFGCTLSYMFNPVSVQTVGILASGFPVDMPLTSVGTMERGLCYRLLLWGIPIAVFSFTEAYVIAKSTMERQKLDADKELAALGFANIWTSFLGSYPVTGSFSRTAINKESGGSSALSYASGATCVLMILVFATPWLSLLPKACTAAIAVSAAVRLVDSNYILDLYHRDEWRQLCMYVVIFVLAMGYGVEVGLSFGLTVDILQLRKLKTE